jgi:Tol biopolymer transport system component
MISCRRYSATAVALALLLAAQAPAAEKRLTNDGRIMSSPVFVDRSGEELVFVVQERAVQTRLMRLRLKDGTVEPLHPNQTRTEFEPACSSDGRYLAFVQSRGNLSLALVIRDTMTGKEAEDPPAAGFAGYRSPAFAPTGGRLLFSFAEEARQKIFSVNLDGGERRTVIDSAGIANWPSFSPDGKRLAFSSTRDGNYEIYVANADGGDVRRLTTDPRQDIRPSFSPDGKRIAFTSNRDGNYEIYVINADGTGLQRLTNNPERDDYAAWHPDGKRLVIVSERQGKHDLYLIDVPPGK